MAIEWKDMKEMIETALSVIDYDYQSSLEILKLNPFDSAIKINSTLQSGIQGIAVSLVSLFFVMQFCNEAMYLKLQSYENIFKLVFKFFLAKGLVDNARGLMGIIYNSFNGLVVSLSSETYGIMSGVKAEAIAQKPADGGWLGIKYLFEYISSIPTTLILSACTWVISLVLIGRLFEVIIYTTVSPIPLAMFAGEGWSESTKNFLKGYAAVCIQALMIVIMFNAFNGISQIAVNVAEDGTVTSNLSVTVTALALALGVSKSGQWARTAVGMA
ncbi:MAG: hypothetical protein NC120_10210 [Ruminococcus sp.]|nr:hypothetical protein [Ruminococcus sp.]